MFDLNCDMGELEESWFNGSDQKLLNYISSINISCGFHAGNEKLIKDTLEKANSKGLKIGIHPGFEDKANFGRKPWPISKAELRDLMQRQIDQFLLWSEGIEIHHIKAHGALYNLLAKDKQLSETYCEVIKSYQAGWIIYCLPKSKMAESAYDFGFPVWHEAFVDRSYRADGSLTPRTEANALILDPEKALRQVKGIVEFGKVQTVSGEEIDLNAQTFCVHGDGENALKIAQLLSEHFLFH